MAHLHEYQQRVVDEKTALDEKISKLDPFIGSDKFQSLAVDEQYRMHRQLKAMVEYSEVLGERISAF